MNRKRIVPAGTVGAVVLALCCTGFVPTALARDAIIVRDVERYKGADRAGIPVGAVLRAWSTDERSRHAFESWFDVKLVEFEQAPGGRVTLFGAVDGSDASWTLDLMRWGLDVRPEIAELGDPIDLATVESVLQRPASALDSAARIYLHLQRAGLLEAEGRREDADRAFGLALVSARELNDTAAAAVVADKRGKQLIHAQQYRRAHDAFLAALGDVEAESLLAVHLEGSAISGLFYLQALMEAIPRLEALLELIVRVAPHSVIRARYQSWLAQMVGSQGDDEREAELVEEALALQRALAPHDADALSDMLDVRGWVAKKRGRWGEAVRFNREAVEIAMAELPESVRTAALLCNLGNIFFSLGDLEEAEIWLEKSLDLYRRVEPGWGEINPLAHLGLVALEHGRLREAEALAHRSVEIAEAAAPDSAIASPALRVLAEVARRRGDPETARVYSDRSLAPILAEWSGSEEEAEHLARHAEVLRDQGEIAAARDLLTEILAERETAEGPRELDAHLRTLIGHFERELGRPDRADALWREALAGYRAILPNGARTASAHALVAEAALDRGDLERAAESIDEGLRIATAVLPGTLAEAELWSLRGRLAERRGRESEALECHCRARDAAEVQREIIGGDDLHRSYLADRLQSYYGNCLRLHAERGDAAAAFEVFEQARGRVLVDLMNRRAADWDAGLDDETKERLHEARRRVRGARLQLHASDPAALSVLRAELTAARAELAEAERSARQATPGSRHRPDVAIVPLDDALETLAERAVFIGYSFTESSAWALVAAPADDGGHELHARALPTDRATLSERADRYLRGLDPATLAPVEVLDRVGGELYGLLLSPIEDLLPSDSELIISPDVPVLELPFAALPLPAAAPTYLVEAYPVRYAHSLSATAYDHHRDANHDAVIGLADPSGHDPATLAELGLHDPSLPGARREAESLDRAFSDRGRTLVGAEAAEAALYRLAPTAEILHFATHGLYDPAYPLSSWILLSPGGGEDGRLEAWEIVERLQTSARLVTLSACESARGQAYAGEGLIGLARALHIAGADMVLASTWRIGDRSTAALMADFYHQLAAGVDVAEALRRAQVAAIRSGRSAPGDASRGVGGLAAPATTVHPFYWAAFRLSE